MSCLVRATPTRGYDAIRWANASASVSNASGSTTRSTSPIRSASAASMFSAARAQVQRAAQPDDPWQEVGHPARGAETKGRVGQPELRADRREPDVAHQRELEPAGQCVAVDRGHDRLRTCPERGRDPHVARDRGCELALVHAGHGRDVATGRERAPTTGQDRSADRLRTADVLDSLEEAVQHLGVDGVELVRPIERDQRDLALGLDIDHRHEATSPR